ncbi:MAG: hypothetical protein QOE70_6202 [Chthoniobacter sp.]|jgi:hypothetical protein|nr:hypothetical protein [Chthoniobacter sp.]
MKTFFLITCISTSILTRLAGESEPGPAATTLARSAPEIEQLQQDFERRRAVALRPVSAWYRERLETLQKRLYAEAPGSEAKVAEVLRAAKEAFWEEDQPELKQALIGSTWLWRSNYDPHGVSVTFRGDRTVDHIGMRGTWRISGPSEVTIRTEEGDRYLLRFNTSLSAYEADHDNVSGVRLPVVFPPRRHRASLDRR